MLTVLEVIVFVLFGITSI